MLRSVLNLVFATSIQLLPDWNGTARTLASRCFLGALVVMPLGFFLGGVYSRGGDPELGILLVPPGALLLFLRILLTAKG